MSLTVKKLEAARFGVDKERLSGANGLYARLYPSGAKRFQVQVPSELGGKRRLWITLGDFPALSLKEARETAVWIRLQVARGWSANQVRAALATRTLDSDHPNHEAATPSKPDVLFREVAAGLVRAEAPRPEERQANRAELDDHRNLYLPPLSGSPDRRDHET